MKMLSSHDSRWPRRCGVVARALLACAAALSLSGCVYLRLWMLQQQLGDFEEHFSVERGEGLTLVFNKPVLYDHDVRKLAQVDPSRKISWEQGALWYWTYSKKPTPGQEQSAELYAMTFVTGFEDGKLTRFTFPPAFLTVVPESFLLGVIRAAGNAEVDRSSKTASVLYDWRDTTPAPTRADIENVLGPPYSVHRYPDRPGETVLFYRYKLLTTQVDADKRVPAWARFTFDDETGTMRRARAYFAGFTLRYSFEREQPEGQVDQDSRGIPAS